MRTERSAGVLATGGGAGTGEGVGAGGSGAGAGAGASAGVIVTVALPCACCAACPAPACGELVESVDVAFGIKTMETGTSSAPSLPRKGVSEISLVALARVNAAPQGMQIGRASCRERVEISVVA